MNIRKFAAIGLAGIMAASMAACGGSSAPATTAAAAPAETTAAAAAAAETTAAAAAADTAAAPEVTLRVAFENSISEPVGAGWTKAQESSCLTAGISAGL